jgi:CheY-like chemotaxis protein
MPPVSAWLSGSRAVAAIANPGEEDIEVVAAARDGLEAVAKTARFDPTVILMDSRMPELDGLEATRRILAADDTAGS